MRTIFIRRRCWLVVSQSAVPGRDADLRPPSGPMSGGTRHGRPMVDPFAVDADRAAPRQAGETAAAGVPKISCGASGGASRSRARGPIRIPAGTRRMRGDALLAFPVRLGFRHAARRRHVGDACRRGASARTTATGSRESSERRCPLPRTAHGPRGRRPTAHPPLLRVALRSSDRRGPGSVEGLLRPAAAQVRRELVAPLGGKSAKVQATGEQAHQHGNGDEGFQDHSKAKG